ncbi:hypothetical protein E2C01_018043 [Portunus trituberculatus]|uniref:Uncharacterized protein n=1 Tax=Portunus trituberculatus TaxID=210409 RepID=A0A5B7DU31_PORTR|nr:hypothetical protein [Portunus trituberculatus]
MMWLGELALLMDIGALLGFTFTSNFNLVSPDATYLSIASDVFSYCDVIPESIMLGTVSHRLKYRR